MEKVIISPHCSSVFDGWEQLSIKMFVENFSRWRNGEALHNQVPAR
jgi:phosphoglycerate dehydrogenase-like enzyme